VLSLIQTRFFSTPVVITVLQFSKRILIKRNHWK